MKDITDKNFGVIIAFLLPGFLFLWGISLSSDVVAKWLAISGNEDTPTVAGFLYATLASLSIGLVISALRWLLIDHLLCLLGISDPGIKFENLKDKDSFAAFMGAVDNHYRYYQYYSNTLVAIVTVFAIYLFMGLEKPTLIEWFCVISIVVALFFGSMDSLRKFYKRSKAILD